MNEELFLVEEYENKMKEETRQYFKINSKQDVKQLTWDAFKATIRGELIALNVSEKKKKRCKLQQIQEELQKKDELKKNPKKKKY